MSSQQQQDEVIAWAVTGALAVSLAWLILRPAKPKPAPQPTAPQTPPPGYERPLGALSLGRRRDPHQGRGDLRFMRF